VEPLVSPYAGLGGNASRKSSLWPLCPACLRQHRLCLGQPERHVHGAVDADGSHKFSPGLLSPAYPGIQCAEVSVAVGLERAHAEILGQGEGLLVVGFGLLGSGGTGVGLDDAKLVQRERLVPACLELPGQIECLMRVLPGLLTASCQAVDLAEPCNPVGMICHCAYADTFADRLLQQRAPLREAPLERRSAAQAPRDPSQHGLVAGGTTEGRPWSYTRMACSRSPWVRYRKPRHSWAVSSVGPRPSSVARRKCLLPMALALGEGPERT
jgi:hypothetical protein